MTTRTDVLQVKYETDGDGKVKASLASVGQGMKEVGKASEAASLQGELLAGVLGAGLLESLNKLIEAASEADAHMKQLEAALASSGGAAGFTREQLVGLSQDLAKSMAFSSGEIQKAETALLSFTDVVGDNYTKALQAALNMSARLGIGVEESATLIGRSLEAPDQAMTALARHGIVFSQALQANIKDLVDTGHAAEAQTLVLDRLGQAYEGAASAAQNSLSGALALLKNRWDALVEERTGGLFSQVVIDGVKALADHLEQLADIATVVGGVMAARLAGQGLAAVAAGFTAAEGGAAAFATGLLGGPWGWAALAIGALATAALASGASFELAAQQAGDLISQLQRMPREIDDSTEAFDQHNITAEAFIGKWKEAAEAIGKGEAALAAVQDKLSGAVAGWGVSQTQIEEMRRQVSILTVELNTNSAKWQEMTERLAAMSPAAADLRSELESLDATDLSHLAAQIQSLFGGALNAADFDASWAAAKKRIADAAATTQQYTEQLASFGKTRTQLAQQGQADALKQAAASATSKKQLDDETSAIKSQFAALIQQAGGLDGAEAAQKAAAEASQRAAEAARQEAQSYQSLTDRVQGQIALDKAAETSTDSQTAAERLATEITAGLADGKIKLTDAHRKALEALLPLLVAQGRETSLAVQLRNDLEQEVELRATIAETTRQQAEGYAQQLAALGHGQQWAQQHQALQQIADDFGRQRDEAKKAYDEAIAGGKDAGQALQSYNRKLADLSDGYRDADAAARRSFADQSAAMADWRIGAQRALEDYEAAAKDVATQTANAWTSAMGQTEDALVEFVKTGKLDFRSLITDILADFARLQIKQLLAPLFSEVGKLLGIGGDSATGNSAADLSEAAVELTAAGSVLDTSAASLLAAAAALQVAGGASGGAGGGVDGSLISTGIAALGDLWGFAAGGVMGPDGSLPLRKYAAGGIADSPQVALFGEGHMREAYVPLADGRSIPVTVSGGGQGGGNVYVQVINNGNDQVKTETSTDGLNKIVKVLIGAVAHDVASGGQTSQAIQQRFGVGPAPFRAG